MNKSITEPIREPEIESSFATRNACNVCAPLGACLVFRGIRGAIPFLHGGQGCATYIRRYLISHFREPMDIASSNFGEKSAIFGGGENFRSGIRNVQRQYAPSLIGIATTCLSETIGEDVPLLINQYLKTAGGDVPALMVHVSTPSYQGTHIDGFHNAVKAVVAALSCGGPKSAGVNLFPGMVSPEDLRYLKEILSDFEVPSNLLPDYSETLDGGVWDEYQEIPPGGTTVAEIAGMGRAAASVEFGRTLQSKNTASDLLVERFGVPAYKLGMPIGIRETDEFFLALQTITGRPLPVKYEGERGRLIDSLIDGHKYVFEKRAIVFGDEDLVIGLTCFLSEIGVKPVLVASGGKSGRLASCLRAAVPELDEAALIMEDSDFAEISEAAEDLVPDLLIGTSKGNSLERKLGIPLVRVGFPIHDRIGAQRRLHLGYRGAQRLFDEITNTLLAHKQQRSPVAWSYM